MTRLRQRQIEAETPLGAFVVGVLMGGALGVVIALSIARALFTEGR